MALTRREFLESGVGGISVLSFSLLKIPGLEQIARAAEAQKVAEVPVIWMATGACSGCSIALLNTASPTIQEALLGQVLPGKHLSLGFHATVMAAAGDKWHIIPRPTTVRIEQSAEQKQTTGATMKECLESFEKPGTDRYAYAADLIDKDIDETIAAWRAKYGICI